MMTKSNFHEIMMVLWMILGHCVCPEGLLSADLEKFLWACLIAFLAFSHMFRMCAAKHDEK